MRVGNTGVWLTQILDVVLIVLLALPAMLCRRCRQRTCTFLVRSSLGLFPLLACAFWRGPSHRGCRQVVIQRCEINVLNGFICIDLVRPVGKWWLRRFTSL